MKKHLTPLILVAVILLGCTNQQLVDNLDIASSFGKSIITSMKAKLPEGDERFNKAEDWIERVEKFKVDYEAATTPDEKVKLAPLLASITDSFSSDILAMTNLNPVAVAGIDAALRLVVRQFQKDVKKASPAEIVVAQATAKVMSVDLDDSAVRLNRYLASPQVVVKK